MTDPTPPVMTTPNEQRKNTTLSLQILQDGAKKHKQKIAAEDIPWDVEPQPHHPATTVIPGKQTGYRRNRFNSKAPGNQDYSSGTGYQDNNETVGYSKQDLEDIQKLLKAGDYKALEEKYGIDSTQLKTEGQVDPKKVQALQQTLDVLIVNYDTAVDLSDDQVRADVFIDYFDKTDPVASNKRGTGFVMFRDRKNMTPADFQKLIDEAKQAEAGQPPIAGGNPNAALLVKRIGQRNELTTTTFPDQESVNEQLAEFIDVLIKSNEAMKEPLTKEKLEKFAKVFDPKTTPEELKKIAEELKIPVETLEKWRQNPEVMKLGQGFTHALQDQNRRGVVGNLYPPGMDNVPGIRVRDLMALKAEILGQSPPPLPDGVDAAPYHQRVRTCVSDMRIQLVGQGYIRKDLRRSDLPPQGNPPGYAPTGGAGYYPGGETPMVAYPSYQPLSDTMPTGPFKGGLSYGQGPVDGPMGGYPSYGSGGLYGSPYGDYGGFYGGDFDSSGLPGYYGKGFDTTAYPPMASY